MRVATFNLLQFCPPPFYWYERFDGDGDRSANAYSEAEWAAKTGWIADRLTRAAADLVGFQEVFDPVALRALVQTCGYETLVTAPGAAVPALPDDPQVLTGPIVALACRPGYRVLRCAGLEPPAPALAALGQDPDFHFARTPILAEIETPRGNRIKLVVAHLKSKSVRDQTPLSPLVVGWEVAAMDQLRHLSRGRATAAHQRATEAALIYDHIARDLLADPQAAWLVLGDLNDTPRSIPLLVLRVDGRVFRIGGIDTDQAPPGIDARALLHRFQLASVFEVEIDGAKALHPPHTHIHNGQRQTVDYVLLSNALNPHNPARWWQPVARGVDNAHLDADWRTTSDHGIVLAEFAPPPPPPPPPAP